MRAKGVALRVGGVHCIALPVTSCEGHIMRFIQVSNHVKPCISSGC